MSRIKDHKRETLGKVSPDHTILHAITSNLRTENTANQIAKARTDQAILKQQVNNKFSNKANEFNNWLVLTCKESNAQFLSLDEYILPINHFKINLNKNKYFN